MDYTIKTNHQPRELIACCDLTAEELLEDSFDYIDNDDRFSYRLFRYKGFVYDTNQFMPTNSLMGNDLKAWHGYHGDSYFSGLLIKYKGMDRVIVARYTC